MPIFWKRNDDANAHRRKKPAYYIFSMAIEWLEKYIELADYYPDGREQKSQIEDKKLEEFETYRNNNRYIISNHYQQKMQELEEKSPPLEKTKIRGPINSLENPEEQFSTILLDLSRVLESKPYYLREELRQQYHHWISSVGINIDTCHPQLKSILLEFNGVLEGRGEEIIKELRNMDNLPKFTSLSSSIQTPLNKESSSSYTVTNYQIIQDIRNNPQNWRFEAIDGQIYLVHNSAQIKRDEIGTLIHSQQSFNQAEIEEINRVLNSWRLKKELVEQQKHLASLIKQRKETKDKIPGTIEEVVRFKTWWSNYNVATVINHCSDYYQVFLVVYEPQEIAKNIAWDEAKFRKKGVLLG